MVVVLCIVLGLFLIIGGCVATCTYYVGKKAKTLSAEAQRNPQYAALSAYAYLNPNIQVISKDGAKAQMTLRNKQTGEVVTINADDFSAENITQALQKFAAGQGLPSPATAPSSSTVGGSAPGRRIRRSARSRAGASAAFRREGGGVDFHPQELSGLCDPLSQRPHHRCKHQRVRECFPRKLSIRYRRQCGYGLELLSEAAHFKRLHDRESELRFQ